LCCSTNSLSYPDNSRNERTATASNPAGMDKNAMETFKLLTLAFGEQAKQGTQVFEQLPKFKSGVEYGECSEYSLMAKQLNLIYMIYI